MSQVESTTPTATRPETRRGVPEGVRVVVDHRRRLLAGARLLPVDLDLGAPVVLAVLLRADARLAGPTDIEAALQGVPTLLPGGDPRSTRSCCCRCATRSRWVCPRCRSSSCWWSRRSCRTGVASSAARPTAVRPADTGRSGAVRCPTPRPRSTSTRTTPWRPSTRRGSPRGQVAEAPDARPRQLHPLPRMRGRLPVELHLHDVARHRRRRCRARRGRRGGQRHRGLRGRRQRVRACSVCVDRCPTDTLYYARLPEGSKGGQRTMAEVPTSYERPRRPDGSRAHAAEAVARRRT